VEVCIQLLHSRIAQTLETLHAGDSGAASAQIAWHYEQARALEQAITRYREAAKVVRLRYAEEEAIRYLTKALNLLKGLLGTPERDRLELGLLVTLGPSLLAPRGLCFARSRPGVHPVTLALRNDR
jgi:hypothetical protein